MNRARLRIFVLMLAGLTACATPESHDETGTPVVTLDRKHSEAWSHPGYLNAKTLQVIPLPHTPQANEMLVRGTIIGGFFHPDGDLLGALQDAPAGELSQPAFLALRDRRLSFPSEGKPPEPPYLPGRYDAETGLFYPSQSTVVASAP
ncbi:MAG: hypothetical protein KDB53_08130 [Planctomycetes bacterium]|nr:hypothetical protein [Planctomycetota bacterium]